jgi:hypothetical protein
VLQIYDHDLNLLAAQDDGSFGQGEQVAARVPAAGRYYLRVSNTGGAQSRGSYIVAVARTRPRLGRP